MATQRVECKPCGRSSPKLPADQAKQGARDHDQSMHGGAKTARTR